MSSAQGTKTARGPVVLRRYGASPEACTRAVALLLQSSVNKKRGRLPDKSGLDDTREESRSDSRTKAILPE